jgi:hypothetical protein
VLPLPPRVLNAAGERLFSPNFTVKAGAAGDTVLHTGKFTVPVTDCAPRPDCTCAICAASNVAGFTFVPLTDTVSLSVDAPAGGVASTRIFVTVRLNGW